MEDNTALRQRSRTPCPSPFSEKVRLETKQNKFYEFQLKLRERFKDIAFSSEYYDPECKRTTCIISDFVCDIKDLCAFETKEFKFTYQHTSLFIQYTPSDDNDIQGTIIDYKKTFVFISFFMIIFITMLFIWKNVHLYSKLFNSLSS